MIEFKVLGSVEVWCDGVARTFGSRTQRHLLALLLAQPDVAVPPEQLASALWPDEPPATTSRRLWFHVSRLRGAIAVEPTAASALATVAGGYRLSGGEAFDVHRFDALLGRARTATDPNVAARLRRDALALWRGEPFAGFDGASIDAQRVRLERQRFEAMVAVLDHRIVEEPGAALADIESLRAAHPHDERLCGLAMRALYDVGSQADALACYRSFQRRLGEELGLAPSPHLRELEEGILRHEIPRRFTVAVEPELARAEPQHQLPTFLTSYVGRAEGTARVAQLLRAHRLVTITGAGGVGKTRLAVEAAGMLTPPTGRVVFVDLTDLPPSPATASGDAATPPSVVDDAFLIALGVPQQLGSSRDTLVAALGAPTLTVLDNAEHVLPEVADLLLDVLPRCPSLVVLVTTRAPLGIAGEQVWPLEPLNDAEACLLFHERATAVRPTLPTDARNQAAVLELCRRVDGLPLAVELTAARTRSLDPVDLVTRFETVVHGATDPRSRHPRHRTVDDAIGWSYDMLSPVEQAIFGRLAVFEGGCTLSAAEAVCATPEAGSDAVDNAIDGLLSRSMLTIRAGRAGSRYRLLEPLRAFAADRLVEQGAHGAAADAHLAWCRSWWSAAAEGLGGPREADWVASAADEYLNLRAAFNRARDTGRTSLAMQLLACGSFYATPRCVADAVPWALEALALPGASDCGTSLHLVCHMALCGLERSLQFDRFDDVLVVARATGGFVGPLSGFFSLKSAIPPGMRGEHAVALAMIDDGVATARRCGPPAEVGLGAALTYRAYLLSRLERRTEASACLDEASRLVLGRTSPSIESYVFLVRAYLAIATDVDAAIKGSALAAQHGDRVANLQMADMARGQRAALVASHAPVSAAIRDVVASIGQLQRNGALCELPRLVRHAAILLARAGDAEGAVVVHNAVDGHAGWPLTHPELARGLLRHAVAALGPERAATARTVAAAMPLDRTCAYALDRLAAIESASMAASETDVRV